MPRIPHARALAPARSSRRPLLALACALLFAGCVHPAPNLERGPRPSPAGIATVPMKPLSESSDEATQEQLRLARQQGFATQRALDALRRDGVQGAEMAAGEYLVAYTLTPPRGWYELAPGGLQWREPGDASAHLAVYVRDGADGRLVPGLEVRAKFLDAAGRSVDERPLPFAWDPFLNAYADNVRLPAGTYRLRIEIPSPAFRRHDPVNGDRFTEGTFAEFARVALDPGALAQPRARDAYLAAARDAGEALKITLREMTDATATDGAEVRVGDYLVGYAVEYAEGYWHGRGEELEYLTRVEASTERNAHVEVSVRDALTGRFMPGLNVKATLIDEKGNTVGTRDEPFMWHPCLYHYGENWRVPKTGNYRLRIRVEAPAYRRYDRELGRRFAEPVDVEFPDIFIRTGQK